MARTKTYIATRPLKVGHGYVHAGEDFPEAPTAPLLSLGHVVEGVGPRAADPLAGVYDPDEAAAIQERLAADSATDTDADTAKPKKRKTAKGKAAAADSATDTDADTDEDPPAER
jgi:hypothetical protein